MNNFQTFEEFALWWTLQNPAEPMNVHEAWTIFFNQETYLGE